MTSDLNSPILSYRLLHTTRKLKKETEKTNMQKTTIVLHVEEVLMKYDIYYVDGV